MKADHADGRGSVAGDDTGLSDVTEVCEADAGATRTIRWTAAQEEAIRFGAGSVLVSAAAGSGKTAVLAARCAQLVCDAPSPCDVDELLVVTYTDAAATEMKQRIAKALRERLGDADARGVGRLARQIALIDRAQISTLHGFCAQIVRQNYHALGLDPAFTILDADEAVLLRHETVHELFLQRYETDESGDFQRMIDSFGDGDDAHLMEEVVATHELLGSLVDPAAWRSEARRRIEQGMSGRLEESDLGREWVAIVRRHLDALLGQCAAAGREVGAMGGFDKYTVVLREWYTIIRHWRKVLDEHGLDALGEETSVVDNLPRLAPIPAGTPGKEVAQQLVTALRKQMKSGMIADALRFTADEWRDGLRRIIPYVDVFLNLVESFGEAYTAAKTPLRVIDFSDLERLALRVLNDSTDATLRPSDAARRYQREFRHVLVDEYQDINQVQDAILSLVSGEEDWRRRHEGGATAKAARSARRADGSLFCVGDVKQSVYRFRLAEPARFLEREAHFRQHPGDGRVIDLQQNFRSRGPLIDAVNGVFERLMTGEAVEINYDETHRLNAGAIFPAGATADCFKGAPFELHLLPKGGASGAGGDEEPAAPAGHAGDGDIDEGNDLDGSELEATLLASRINDMMGKGGSTRRLVAERDGTFRPIEYRDIVILLRAMRFKADQFSEVLRQNGIPVHSESGTGYFQSMEVRDLLALLNVLDNPRQDIPLAAFLRSPLVKLPDVEDAMARLRLAFMREADPPDFHQAVVRYAEERSDALAERLRELLLQLSRWREYAQRRPLAELIWTIYQESGYLAFVAGLHDGEQRVANLLHLHERARQFGTFRRQGLYRFLRFLEQLRDEKDIGQPSIAGEADNVVRIMTIHRAKGLEFPVVMLPDLGKAHNRMDSAGSILVDRREYLGMSVIDEERRIRYPSLPLMLVQHRLQQQAQAEELRLLYVAMTRAREHLICVGTAPADAWTKWLTRWSHHTGAMPVDMVLGGRSMLDWLAPAAAAMGSIQTPLCQVTVHDAREIAAWPTARQFRPALDAAQQALAALTPLAGSVAEDATTRQVIDRLTRRYRHEQMTTTPAAQSVTRIVKEQSPPPVRRAASSKPPAGDDANVSTAGAASIESSLRLPAFISAPTDNQVSLARGSATHLVLQHLDFGRVTSASDVARQIASLQESGVLNDTDAAMVDHESIRWFLDTPLGRMMRNHAGLLMRELPFALAVPPESATTSETIPQPLDQIMVRGRLDAVISTNTGLVIVDYKTDIARTADSVRYLTRLYAPQTQWYAKALRKITGRDVAGIHLVFLTARQIAAITVE